MTAVDRARFIRDALDQDVRIDSGGLSVDVDGSTVELRGQVSSHSERLAAVETVVGIDGIEHVDNRITVHLRAPGGFPTDDTVAAGVMDALADAGFGRGTIDASVVQRVVTLTGYVASVGGRARARHAVQTVAGVDFVVNDIVIAS